MEATAEKLEGSRVRLKVQVDPKDVGQEYDRAIRRVAQQVNIRGFRRGKAPRHIVENYVGTERVLHNLVEHLIPRAYAQAVQQTGVEPIEQPTLDVPDTPSLSEPLTFSAEVAVSPTAELGDLSDIRIEPETPEVTDAEVDARLDELGQAHSTWESVDRAAAAGDLVQVRVSVSGEGVEPREARSYSVILGENQFPAGFDEAVQGLKVGEQTEYVADMPHDDPNVELRGNRLTFGIEVEGVNERRPPELNDEFARNLGGLESLEALREQVREREMDAKRHQALHRLEDEALDALVARATFDIPDVLIEREQRSLVESQTRSLVAQGIAVDTYLGMTGQTRGEWQQEAREQAEGRVRRGVALEAFADTQGISVEAAEVEAECDRIAAMYPEERRPTVRRSLLQPDHRRDVEASVRNRRALARLVEMVTGGQALVGHHDHEPEPPAEVIETADAAAAAEPVEPTESEPPAEA